MTVVDIHPHIASTDTERYPITPIGGKRSDWSHKRSVDAEQLIAAMDEAGVDHAALVHSSTTYGFNCEYAADAVAAYPDRLTGVFSIDVTAPDAPQLMEKWFKRGMTGMRIFSRGSTLSEAWLRLDDPRVFPCYEKAAELGMAVTSNTTVDVFDQFENVLKQFPQVTFVLEHLGKVDFEDGAPFNNAEPLWRLARYPNVYLKVASRNFEEANDGKSTNETKFKRLVAEFGADRMAWGSNYPASAGSLKDLLNMARETVSFLSTSDQEWLFGKTALKLYPALTKVAAKA